MYFDSEETEKSFLYWRTLDPLSQEAKKLEREIWEGIFKVMQGIIFTKKYTRWFTIDECYSFSFLALMRVLPNYDPSFEGRGSKKDRFFNFISGVVDNSLRWSRLNALGYKKRHPNRTLTDDFANEDQDTFHVDYITSLLKLLQYRDHTKCRVLKDEMLSWIENYKSFEIRDFNAYFYKKHNVDYRWVQYPINKIRRDLKALIEQLDQSPQQSDKDKKSQNTHQKCNRSRACSHGRG